MNVEQELVDWINRTTGTAEVELRADTSLIASGRLHSLQILELIEFAEGRFTIRLFDEDMHPDNFESVRALAQIVRRRMAAPASSIESTE